MYIMGNIPTLGSWDVQKAFPMQQQSSASIHFMPVVNSLNFCLGGNLYQWTATVKVPKGLPIEYKFISNGVLYFLLIT
jgi:hypothetical protein